MIEWLKALQKRLGTSRRIDLYEFLTTLLEGGKEIQTAMGMMAEAMERQIAEHPVTARGLKPDAEVYREIEEDLRKGTALHACLSDLIPDSEGMMLMAGAKGNIVDGLRAAARQAKRTQEMMQKIAKGIIYPVVIFFVSLFVIDFLGSSILVEMKSVYPVNKWSPDQQTLWWITNNVEVWGAAVVMIALSVVGIVYAVAKLVTGPLRESLHFVPPLNVVRKTTGATYLGTLASLIQSGSTIKDSLTSMKNHSTSSYLRYYIEDASVKMRIGESSNGPGRAIASPLFTPRVTVKLDVHGRRAGASFSETLHNIAQDAQKEAITSVAYLSWFFNIAILVGTLATIGFTILTMYSIADSLRNTF